MEKQAPPAKHSARQHHKKTLCQYWWWRDEPQKKQPAVAWRWHFPKVPHPATFSHFAHKAVFSGGKLNSQHVKMVPHHFLASVLLAFPFLFCCPTGSQEWFRKKRHNLHVIIRRSTYCKADSFPCRYCAFLPWVSTDTTHSAPNQVLTLYLPTRSNKLVDKSKRGWI